MTDAKSLGHVTEKLKYHNFLKKSCCSGLIRALTPEPGYKRSRGSCDL